MGSLNQIGLNSFGEVVERVREMEEESEKDRGRGKEKDIAKEGWIEKVGGENPRLPNQ